MKNIKLILSAAGAGLLAVSALAQNAGSPYKVLDTTKVMGTGGIDYVYADNDGRRIYVPRGGQTFVFDLDSHQLVGTMTNISGHGVAIDSKSHHGISSSRGGLGMFDTQTLQKIKSIEVQGGPDGILYEPFTGHVFVLSHSAPSLTEIDAKDGSVVGTIEVGGAMEQAQSDGKGRLYADVEDEKKVAVIDLKTRKLVTKYDLGEGAGEPAGLGFDAKNNILFAMCANPDVCVILNANDGKVLAKLPIGSGSDSAGFNPKTMEAFSSQRDGTLSVIKENSPTSFEVEQTVQTMRGAKTCSLDAKNNRIVLITTERATTPPAAATAEGEKGKSAETTPAPGPGADEKGKKKGGKKGGGGPGNLDVIIVGR